MALVHPERLSTADRRLIDVLTGGFSDRTDYFTDRLCRGTARIAPFRRPASVIARTSDRQDGAEQPDGRGLQGVCEAPHDGAGDSGHPPVRRWTQRDHTGTQRVGPRRRRS